MHGAQRGGASCHSEFVGADDSVRPFPVIPSQCEHRCGNPSPQKRKTDCRVATRLAMTARRRRADGTSYPKGICSAALHCRTPSPTRGSTYRPVGRGPRAPPKNAYPAAGHMGPALQVHTTQKNNAAPRKGRRAYAIDSQNISLLRPLRNRFRRNFHILDRCTKFGGELL